MSAFPGPANPIFFSQFRIRGGWKAMLGLAGAYAVIIGGLISITGHASEVTGYTSTMRSWLDVLLGLQMFFLIIFGTSRVNAAVRGDVSGKIIESHRLMPLSAFSAVVGYVTGPPIQTVALAAVTFIVGIFTTAASDIDIDRWIVANAMIAAFVVLIWVIAAQMAFSTRGGFMLIVVTIGIAVFSNAAATGLLPGLSVITCPIFGRSVFNLRANFSDLTFPFALALLSQLMIGSICFAAAMRKYRLPDGVGFNTFLSVMLLLAWVAISLMGITFNDQFVSNYYGRNAPNLQNTQFIASIVSAMLLAFIPLATVARANDDYRRHPESASIQRKPLAPSMICLAVIAVIGLFLSMQPSTSNFVECSLRTLSILLPFVISIELLFRWAYRVFSKAWVIVLIWLFIFWLTPIIADGIYHAMGTDVPEPLTAISTLSPIGALIITWTQHTKMVDLGIAFQWATALLPLFLYVRAWRRTPPATESVG